jgi:hypothetical protein
MDSPSRKEANRRYYIKNKAKLSENRRKRYLDVEKPQSARKQFIEMLTQNCK